MLVYATQLQLGGRDGDARTGAMDAVREWISLKCRVPMADLQLTDRARHSLPESRRVEAWSTSADSDEHPRVNAVRFSHPDRDVRGRLWVTEAGIRQMEPEGPVEATVVLTVEDVSTRVAAPVSVSRPGVVAKLVQRCRVLPPTPGGEVQLLADEDIPEFCSIVDDPARRHAIVLLSPDKFTENPLVDAARLARQLVGIGDVFYIQNKFSTFRFTQALGQAKAAWDGAINILLPPRGGTSAYVPTRRLLARQIHAMEDEGTDLVGFILGTVTHATNLPVSWRHISPESVRRARLERRIRHLRSATAVDDEAREFLALFKEENESLHSRVGELEGLVQEGEARIDLLKSENGRLKYHLGRKSSSPVAVEAIPEPRHFGDLGEVAEAVEEDFDGRVLLTNRARRTMKDSPYLDATNAYRAFEVLANDFHPMLAGSRSLPEVEVELTLAGFEYASKMPSTTMGRFPGYDARYKGQQADFNRHLKLGDSRDPTRCFRIHFEWDAEDKVIVVHHAGKHLTTTQS